MSTERGHKFVAKDGFCWPNLVFVALIAVPVYYFLIRALILIKKAGITLTGKQRLIFAMLFIAPFVLSALLFLMCSLNLKGVSTGILVVIMSIPFIITAIFAQAILSVIINTPIPDVPPQGQMLNLSPPAGSPQGQMLNLSPPAGSQAPVEKYCGYY